jgi:drug/metabolite transporter (DMT)-like permease
MRSRIDSADAVQERHLREAPEADVIGRWKTWALTVAVVVFSVIGNTALGHGMRQVGSGVVSLNPLPYLEAFANPWVVGGFLVLVLWMIAELALLSRADLSFVLPVTSSAYVLIAIAGHFVLKEPISATRWAGIAVITLGVIMVSETPPRTTPEPPPEGHHR